MALEGSTPEAFPLYALPTFRITNSWAQQTRTGLFQPPELSTSPARFDSGDCTSSNGANSAPFAASRNECYLVSRCNFGPDGELLLRKGDRSLESIMNMIINEIGKEQDAFATQREGNLVLERELRQVQQGRRDAELELHKTEALLFCVKSIVKEQQNLLNELRHV
ncbi:hypothetical protein, conserved [Trypanosoma brucei gambiense DAL972]|uniref:Uncharacterized protein n=2 Tax=Trypanosoma brucei TaxID=5691 RepID=D0A7Z7_TRYB9|nr:hypothetical protein, conserved [Trypanosoma brucei gambiense DAL972]RHW67842.1 hypothetical protein DPX39_110050800 [Trypanosoma brucei equiperdum]CBH17798.1 hypothetical protein, conserved [Trypanosoma brucei gambiense DAL972]|eukprot:XP_011780062.1 hypothetical protein, conserved [Trypanosoma brucei gambiense DAL972]